MNIQPLAASFPGVFYDGQSAISQSAALQLQQDHIQFETETICYRWPVSACRLVSDGSYGEPVRLEFPPLPAAALEVSDPAFPQALAQFAPALMARPWWDRRLDGWASLIQSAAGILVVAGAFYYFGLAATAELGARFAPRSVEDRLGHSVVQLLAPPGRACPDGPAMAPLRKVEQAVFSQVQSPYQFQVTYARLGQVNAFAAPGGAIVVSRELIQFVKTPEEYAAVLAHEVHHILNRDSLRAMARQLGGSVLLSMLSVDPSSPSVFLNQSTSLLGLRFSRDAERAADLGAVRLLRQAAISEQALIQFLTRLESLLGGLPGIPTYFSTHPDNAQRIASIRQQPPASFTPRVLLSEAEWRQAQTICQSDSQ